MLLDVDPRLNDYGLESATSVHHRAVWNQFKEILQRFSLSKLFNKHQYKKIEFLLQV
jgi:hypothetical protein